jgi:hypothetical protein
MDRFHVPKRRQNIDHVEKDEPGFHGQTGPTLVYKGIKMLEHLHFNLRLTDKVTMVI